MRLREQGQKPKAGLGMKDGKREEVDEKTECTERETEKKQNRCTGDSERRR